MKTFIHVDANGVPYASVETVGDVEGGILLEEGLTWEDVCDKIWNGQKFVAQSE